MGARGEAAPDGRPRPRVRSQPGHPGPGDRHPRGRGTRLGSARGAGPWSGTACPGRGGQRGNLVKRNVATDSPGYSFPSASGQEVWTHRIKPTARPEKMTDPRLARMLGVPEGTEVMRRLRVTGPETEPPFQINDSWIHPRGVADAPGSRRPGAGPGRLALPARGRRARAHLMAGNAPGAHADQGRGGPPADPHDAARSWKSCASAPRRRTDGRSRSRCTSSRATGSSRSWCSSATRARGGRGRDEPGPSA